MASRLVARANNSCVKEDECLRVGHACSGAAHKTSVAKEGEAEIRSIPSVATTARDWCKSCLASAPTCLVWLPRHAKSPAGDPGLQRRRDLTSPGSLGPCDFGLGSPALSCLPATEAPSVFQSFIHFSSTPSPPPSTSSSHRIVSSLTCIPSLRVVLSSLSIIVNRSNSTPRSFALDFRFSGATHSGSTCGLPVASPWHPPLLIDHRNHEDIRTTLRVDSCRHSGHLYRPELRQIGPQNSRRWHVVILHRR